MHWMKFTDDDGDERWLNMTAAIGFYSLTEERTVIEFADFDRIVKNTSPTEIIAKLTEAC